MASSVQDLIQQSLAKMISGEDHETVQHDNDIDSALSFIVYHVCEDNETIMDEHAFGSPVPWDYEDYLYFNNELCESKITTDVMKDFEPQKRLITTTRTL